MQHVNPDANSDFSLNVAAFIEGMKNCDIAVVTNPHDVTGAIIPSEDLARIIEEAGRFAKTLIIDERYGEFSGVVSPVRLVANTSIAMILRTFSSFYALAGLRIGYGIGSAALIRRLVQDLRPCSMNILGPQAALASLRDKGFQKRTLLFIEGEKAYFAKKLSAIGGVSCHMRPGNLLLVRLQGMHGSLKEAFLKYRMLIDEFSDEDGNAFIRFPVQTRQLNAIFVRTLKRIVEV
jgi:histidinol-phosphate/aromatic aminotransferase/cobyric acid decarboxylase-like protein